MAKHNIRATSTVCSAANHSWLPGLAVNYRQCERCRTVEVLVDGQWVPPTGRAKRSSHDAAAAPSFSWMQDVQGVQAKSTGLIEMPAATLPVVPAPSSDDFFRSLKRQDKGLALFVWGREHGYPQLRVRLPGREHVIVSGVSGWRATCDQCSMAVIEAALEQADCYKDEPLIVEAERPQREALLAFGQARDWQQFTYKTTKPKVDGYRYSFMIGGGERDWIRFAYHGSYGQVCEACERLAQEWIVSVECSVPRHGLQQVRNRFLALAKEAGYPVLRFRVAGDGVVYKVAGGGEAEYGDRALDATLGWLWNAIQALEQVLSKRSSEDVREQEAEKGAMQ